MKKITKKKPFGRIIRSYTKGDYELHYHATKGWRVFRK